tara:strand:- start:30 stop:185 length:156 start_codon:yes stop_codon:yes gene_type:complete
MSVILYDDPYKKIVKDIWDLIKENPNNMELGKLIRQYHNDLIEKEQAKKFK